MNAAVHQPRQAALELKRFQQFQLKRASADGSFEAVIATLGVVDKDGDVIAPGAFGSGQEATIIPAHDWGSIPLGRARIVERGKEAVAIGQFNLGITSAREWHSFLKFDLEHGRPIQEWSFGFTVKDAGSEIVDGQRVRVLKALDVHEVSPVLVGAGENTRTLAAKGRQRNWNPDDDLRQIASKVDAARNSRYGYCWVWGSKRLQAAYALSSLAANALGLKTTPVPQLYRPADPGEPPDFTSADEYVGQANTGDKFSFDSGSEAPIIHIIDVPVGEMLVTLFHEVRHEFQREKGWDWSNVDLIESDAEEWGQWFASQFAMPASAELSLEPEPITPADLRKGRAWLDLKSRRLYRAALGPYGPTWLLHRELHF